MQLNTTSHLYIATYLGSPSDGAPSKLPMSARTDPGAMRELNLLVQDGWRNSTIASVRLQDGTTYSASNKHGKAVAHVSRRGL